MMRTILLVTTAAVLLAVATACSTSASEPAHPETPVAPVETKPFEDTTWQLLELRGAAARPGLKSEPPSVRFQADVSSVHGHGGVNSFFGPYVLDGSTLRVDQLAATRMAGPSELMDQESALLTALQAARSWRVTGDVLELFDVRGAMLARFQASSSDQP
jgi:heat shock protein HslJ